MKEAKILLTINLEGVLSNKTEVAILPFVKHDEKGLEVVSTGYFASKTRIPSICVKKVRLDQDTYEHFTNPFDCPAWYKAKQHQGKEWETLSEDERIVQHCIRIAEGRPFEYVILNN